MIRKKWIIAALLFAATLLNYLDRQVLALVSPVLRVHFSLSAVQYARLLNAFLLGYTVMQVLTGWFVDRLGARKGLMLAMIWWSLAGAAAAAARSPFELGLCLCLMGAGEAANWPTAVKAIREWFPPTTRAIGVGFFNAGSSAGAVLAPLLVTALTLHFSWRIAFLFCGALGMLWIFPWRNAYSHAPFNAEAHNTKSYRGLSFLLDVRAWGIILARFFGDSIWYFYIFWLPDYLHHVLSLSLASIGRVAWIPFLAAGLGNFAGGGVSGSLVRRRCGVVASRLIVMGGSALIMATGAEIRWIHTEASAIAAISLVVFAYSAWAANVLTLPSDIFPVSQVATITGAAGTTAGVGGMLTMWLTGRIVDHFSYGPVFVMLGCLPVLAFACSLLSGRDRGEGGDLHQVAEVRGMASGGASQRFRA
ncbi:MAG TPA: MFS transporter [Candidatus Aquilonibacter sp.]|nr:MFS transporter [Candidatus Aquilonibacter sp.]